MLYEDKLLLMPEIVFSSSERIGEIKLQLNKLDQNIKNFFEVFKKILSLLLYFLLAIYLEIKLKEKRTDN